MTIKNAAFLALIGTALIAALLTWNFISTLLNVVAGVAAPLLLFSSLAALVWPCSFVYFTNTRANLGPVLVSEELKTHGSLAGYRPHKNILGSDWPLVPYTEAVRANRSECSGRPLAE
jgi:hypothetical protein